MSDTVNVPKSIIYNTSSNRKSTTDKFYVPVLRNKKLAVTNHRNNIFMRNLMEELADVSNNSILITTALDQMADKIEKFNRVGNIDVQDLIRNLAFHLKDIQNEIEKINDFKKSTSQMLRNYREALLKRRDSSHFITSKSIAKSVLKVFRYYV